MAPSGLPFDIYTWCLVILFHIVLYPESENTWEKKKDIHPEIAAAVEVKLLRYFGSITSEAYPYGKRPGRPRNRKQIWSPADHPDSSGWLYAGTDSLVPDARSLAWRRTPDGSRSLAHRCLTDRKYFAAMHRCNEIQKFHESENFRFCLTLLQ